MSSRNTLILLTEDYPYGMSERSFLKEEIGHLSAEFTNVYIFPIRAGDEIPFDLPINVRTSQKLAHALQQVGSSAKIRGLFSKIFILECFRIMFNPRKMKLALAKSIASEIIKDFIECLTDIDHHRTVYYSYWFNESALAISKIQNTNPSIRSVSRCHNFDLYGNEENGYYVPYQKKILRTLTKVYPVSQDGANFLNQKYSTRVEPRYLGVVDPKTLNSGSSDEVIRIVSCAYMVYRKRLDIIAIGLVHFCRRNNSQKVEWVHIGDGPEFSNVSALLDDKPANLTVNFKGSLTNEEVIDFYKNNSVDLFVNTSEKEGTPVSIMEAISFGIPILVTEFGGNKEVANKGAGHVIPINSNPEDFSVALQSFIDSDRKKLRMRSKKVWELNYNSEHNYIRFSKELSNL